MRSPRLPVWGEVSPRHVGLELTPLYLRISVRSRQGGNPDSGDCRCPWVPACAGTNGCGAGVTPTMLPRKLAADHHVAHQRRHARAVFPGVPIAELDHYIALVQQHVALLEHEVALACE